MEGREKSGGDRKSRKRERPLKSEYRKGETIQGRSRASDAETLK